MNASEINKPKDSAEWKSDFVLQVWFYEAKISEAFYKFWCKITGGKFERRNKERPNSCVLVTKRGFHLFSGLLGRNIRFIPSELEAYQMNRSEKVPYGLGQTALYFRFMKNLNCPDCGRCFELQKDDKKIVGKFYEI